MGKIMRKNHSSKKQIWGRRDQHFFKNISWPNYLRDFMIWNPHFFFNVSRHTRGMRNLPADEKGCWSGSRYSWEKIGRGTTLLHLSEASMELWRASSNRADFSCPAYEFPMVYGPAQRKKRQRRKLVIRGYMSAENLQSYYTEYPCNLLQYELNEIHIFLVNIHVKLSPVLCFFIIQIHYQKAPWGAGSVA